MRLWIIAVVLALAPAKAMAQWQQSIYSSSVYREGPGLRWGDGSMSLHGGVTLENGYDNNVFYQPQNPIGAGILRLRLHLDLAPINLDEYENDQSTANRTFEFKLSTQLEYREYESGNDAVQAQSSLSALFMGEFTLFPRGPFELNLSDVFMHTVDPRNSEGPGSYERDYNRVGILGTYRYSALEIGAGDAFDVNYWESRIVSFADHYVDEAQAFARLRLLPQTIGSLVVRGGVVSYGNNHALDADPLRVTVGGSTLFDSWIGASVNVGYANSFNQHGESYNGPVARAELRFFLPYRTQAMLAYDRDFHDSMFANFFTDDSVMVSVEKPIVMALSARLDFAVRFRHYGNLIDPMLIGAVGYSSSTRDDRVYEAHGEVNDRVLPWLSIGLSYNLLSDDTDFEFLTPTPEPVHYVKQSVFARADFAY